MKTKIGHTESAAGLVGLLKAALAVRYGQVPTPVDRAARGRRVSAR
ncbi:hypothetical protein [Streptomyces eurythermus]